MGETKLRVWWIPQVPMHPFYRPVSSVAEGVLLIDALAAYDEFQFRNRIKPDYSNAGGLQVFDETDQTDSPDGSWIDWCDEETGEDDPHVWLAAQARAEEETKAKETG